MVKVICNRSGLEFEADSKRTKVHPSIRFYTSHSNMEIRYAAILVIERGKAEGWKTVEQFKEEILKALNPPEPETPDYDFEGAWLAVITGADEKYRFKREFPDPVDKSGRFKRFVFPREEGTVFETCYKSAKGNQTRHYYQVRDNRRVYIDLAEVEELFPEIVKPEKVEIDYSNCIKVEKALGVEGDLIKYEDQIYLVFESGHQNFYEDDDGITHEGCPEGGYMYDWTDRWVWLRLATEEQIAQFEAQQELKQRKAISRQRIQEIGESVTKENGAIHPQRSPLPTGRQIVLRQGHYQPNEMLILTETELWHLSYNGRDGDDWSYSNVGDVWMGGYIPLTDKLQAEIEECLSVLNS